MELDSLWQASAMFKKLAKKLYKLEIDIAQLGIMVEVDYSTG